jgi:Tubulin like/GrpE
MASQHARKAFRTMFVGLGGTGNEVIRLVKHEMLRHHYDLPIFQYLVLDTVPYQEKAGMPDTMHLQNGEEYLYIGGYNPNEILKRIDNWPVISNWWGTRDQTNLVVVDEGAGQMRSVGRMGFFRHFTTIQARMERIVQEVMGKHNREMALQQDYDVPNRGPIIYIVFSLCGGTGSSLFFDVAYVLRKLFAVKPTIVGLAMLPGPYVQEISSVPQRERIQANTYAALQEIERLHSIALGQEARPNGRDIWDVQYATNFRVSSPELPFDYIYLVDDVTTEGEHYTREQVYRQMSQAIFWLSGPATAATFWERATNLSSNTLAGGGRPDASGRLRLSKYSSLGISVAALDWNTEHIRQELEALVLNKMRNVTFTSSALPPWLSNAQMLVDRIAREPGVNAIPDANQFKPSGPYKDRAAVDNLIQEYTLKYMAARDSLYKSPQLQRTKAKYQKDATAAIDVLFRERLIGSGPLAALQEMEAVQESLEVLRKRLEELEVEAASDEIALRDEYDRTMRAPDSENSVLVLLSTIGRNIKRLYGFKDKKTSRELDKIAQNMAHQRYRWYTAGFHAYLYREVAKHVIEPAITQAEKLHASLGNIDDELHAWDIKVSQALSAFTQGVNTKGFDSIIRIKPRVSERNLVSDAISKGVIRPDILVNKILFDAFSSWPKQGGNARADLQDAMRVYVADTIQLLGGREHLLNQILRPEIWKQRDMFLNRSDCMWSYGKDVTQEVLSNLEAINLLGYGVERDLSSPVTGRQDMSVQVKELLKQQTVFPERVETDISDEMVYLQTSHGLMISLIKSMPELQHAYQVLNVVRAAPYLHLDYRDQVMAGYGPLTIVEMTAQQVIDTWIEVANSIEVKMGAEAALIRDAVNAYRVQRQNQLMEIVQVKDEGDPLFDFVAMLQAVLLVQNKTPIISETLTKLSDLIGVLHAQGWVVINPAYGIQLDPELHDIVDAKFVHGLPENRIVEVKEQGYVRRRPGLKPQIRPAKVVVSMDDPQAQDVSQLQTRLIP